jgi:hypothetical protein
MLIMFNVLPMGVKVLFIKFKSENVNLTICITETLFAHRWVEAEKFPTVPFKYNNFNMIMPSTCTVPTIRALLQVFALPLLKILALYKCCSSAFQARFALVALKVLLSRISPPHVRFLCKDGLF